MDTMKFNEKEFKKFDTELLSINIEEDAQDLELSGFTTAATFSSAGTFAGGCFSSAGSLSSAGD